MSISSITFGLPALPTHKILPSFIPISAFMMPSTGSIIIAFVITKSAEFSLNTPLAWPNPSLALFPPPKTNSSPYLIISFSISITNSVSANLTLSPTVGPNSSTYLPRGISSEPVSTSTFSKTFLKPFSCMFLIASCFLDSKSPLTNPLKPNIVLVPPNSTTSTCFESPGSNLIDVPDGMLRWNPSDFSLSNSNALFVSEKCVWEPTWIGLSPVLETVNLIIFLDLFAIMFPSVGMYSPTCGTSERHLGNIILSHYWVMYCYKFCSINKCCFNLNCMYNI